MKFSFYAIFQYDSDGICVSFPDIPSALTCASNEIAGIAYAKEALELAFHKTLVHDLPAPSSAQQILLKENQKLFLITIEMEEKEGRLLGRNVKDF